MIVKELKDYKNSLYASLSKELSEFEKNFLLISGGTFAFSITFIKDIVKLDTASYLPSLFLGWACIGSATGLLMLTYLVSVDASYRLWKKVDDFMVSTNKLDDNLTLTPDETTSIKSGVNKIQIGTKNVLRIMRYFSVCLFIVGIASLALFIALNITKKHSEKLTNVSQPSASKEKQVNLKLQDIKIFSNDTLLHIEQLEKKLPTERKKQPRNLKSNRDPLTDANYFHKKIVEETTYVKNGVDTIYRTK